MKTQLTLHPSLIIETVKTETRVKAQVDRASDVKATEIAYQEEAGDEQFHERKLQRGLFSAIDNIKSDVIGFLDSTGTSANIESEINQTSEARTGEHACPADTLLFKLTLSDRFNSAYLTPLAGLFSKFIEDTMLVLWWSPINPNLAKVYEEQLLKDRSAILKCFIKKAPTVPTTTESGTTRDLSYGDVEGNEVTSNS